MRKLLVALLVLAVSGAGSQTVRAGDSFGSRGPFVRTANINTRGDLVPTVTRLQPVIGSVQRTDHFPHPFTHRTKYTGVAYNPMLGRFGTQTQTFRR